MQADKAMNNLVKIDSIIAQCQSISSIQNETIRYMTDTLQEIRKCPDCAERRALVENLTISITSVMGLCRILEDKAKEISTHII